MIGCSPRRLGSYWLLANPDSPSNLRVGTAALGRARRPCLFPGRVAVGERCRRGPWGAAAARGPVWVALAAAEVGGSGLPSRGHSRGLS